MAQLPVSPASTSRTYAQEVRHLSVQSGIGVSTPPHNSKEKKEKRRIHRAQNGACSAHPTDLKRRGTGMATSGVAAAKLGDVGVRGGAPLLEGAGRGFRGLGEWGCGGTVWGFVAVRDEVSEWMS